MKLFDGHNDCMETWLFYELTEHVSLDFPFVLLDIHKKDKNILPPEPINNHLNIPQSPVKSLKPKKRWIKTVVQEQKRQETVIGI